MTTTYIPDYFMQDEKQLTIFISHPSDHLTDCDPHGDGLIAFNFVRRLAERGHRLHICVQSSKIESELPPSVTLYPIEKKTPADTLRHVEYAFRVYSVFQRVRAAEKIDIIHQMNPVRSGLSALLSFAEVPLVLGLFMAQWSADTKDGPKYPIHERIIRYIMKQADRVQQHRASALLLTTKAARSRLYRPDDYKIRTHVMTPGIDTRVFNRDQVKNGKAGNAVGQTILYLGRLHQEKGIFTLLDAMSRVAETVEDVHLIIAGDGPEEEEVKRRVEESLWSDHVSLLGRVARSEVPGLMANCDVFCVPSHGEPFGMSALEAMAMGKPIVATDAGGLAHLVPDKGGYTVPPRDEASLGSALVKMLSADSERIAMGKHNRQCVEERYTWDAVIDKLERIYYTLA